MKYKIKYLNLKNNHKSNLACSFDKNKLLEITYPINGPKEITLLCNGLDDTKPYLTGIKSIDKIITERISNDYTKIKNILQTAFECTIQVLMRRIYYKKCRNRDCWL